MNEHRHPKFVEGCYRCDLGRDELQDSQDWQGVQDVIQRAIDACRYQEDIAIDASEAVLGFARTPEGREVFARALGLEWVESAVETRTERRHFPRGKHNGVLWHARRLVGKWENIPFCRECSGYHSGACEVGA